MSGMVRTFQDDNPVTEKCYKISEITLLIKSLLEQKFFDLSVIGEISNFRPSSTGHWYFSLKDNDAMLQAVMFKNRLTRINFKPEDGMLVKAGGSLSVYPRRGSYQLICEKLAIAGQGNILTLLEKKKQELAQKGFFRSDHKKPLPSFPSRVAVITSPTGAALQDILRVLGRRNAGINLVILPAPVQGEQAPSLIARQIRIANLHRLGDVIIVGRGGGSLEDLLPFYAEEVVEAIFHSEIPVISAVGHEIDISFADLAADCRAATPSAAAEMVAVSTDELLQRIQYLENRIRTIIEQKLENIRILVSQFKLENIERNFRIFIQPYLLRFDDLKETIVDNFQERIKETRYKLELSSRQLAANSPFEILKRGYAVVRLEKNNRALTTSESVQEGDRLDIQLHKGKLKAEVKEKE